MIVNSVSNNTDLLKVENISKDYPTVKALDNVSINVGAGKVVGLYGIKGSGKRTLINAILCKTKPDAGNIFFKESEITDFSPFKRQSLGIITLEHEYSFIHKLMYRTFPDISIQNYFLSIIPSFSKKLNKKLTKNEKLDIIYHTIKSFGLFEALGRRRWSELSGGQRQRILYASCIIREPELIVVDDPFCYLDKENQYRLFNILRNWCHSQNVGFLFSRDTTDTNMDECDDVYLLESGKIIPDIFSSSQKLSESNSLNEDLNNPSSLNNIGTFDVFISYKNTDKSGNQTRDSYLANEIFHFLNEKGVSVFFSNISLESMGVAAYQEAIDNALDKAKILISVGTSLEYLNSEWVRYEWSSFFNDILSKRKTNGKIFVYTENIPFTKLPRILRQNQVIEHKKDSLKSLYNFIDNALNS